MKPKTIPEIIEAIGGASVFSRRLGKRPSTVSEMKRNQSIPVKYWPEVIAAAAERNIKITPDILMKAHLAAED
jgi:hypothetical protein